MSKVNERQIGGDHYKTGGLELWELFGPPFLMGYAAKYVQRWRKKNGVEDLQKALHVCEKLREIAPQYTKGADYLVFADDLIESWFDNSGMDWAERTIVRNILYWRNIDDIDAAIAGIKYLILPNTKPAKPKSKPYVDMTDEELIAERATLEKKQSEATGWGAAVSVRDEFIKEIVAEQAKRERRVPRYDTNIKHTNAEHPDVVRRLKYPNEPWVVTDDTFFADGNWDHPLLTLWYQQRGVVSVLEPYVSASANAPPVSIRSCYTPNTGSWVLDMSRCPKAIRDYFPSLQPSKNLIEWDEAPEWQKRLYKWVPEGNKYVLIDESWHRESDEPLAAHYKTMETGHG